MTEIAPATIGKTVPADFVVEGLLSFFPPDNSTFTTSVEIIHRAFYALKKKYPIVFADFFFDLDRPFPYCDDIEFAFSSLAAAGLVRTQNTYLKYFNTSTALAEHYTRVTRNRVSVQALELRRISEELQRALTPGA
jgi:hypothetical protein